MQMANRKWKMSLSNHRDDDLKLDQTDLGIYFLLCTTCYSIFGVPISKYTKTRAKFRYRVCVCVCNGCKSVCHWFHTFNQCTGTESLCFTFFVHNIANSIVIEYPLQNVHSARLALIHAYSHMSDALKARLKVIKSRFHKITAYTIHVHTCTAQAHEYRKSVVVKCVAEQVHTHRIAIYI